MSWFEELTGFEEQSPEDVRQKIHLEGETLRSSVNGRVLRCGRLELPTLAELRAQVKALGLKGRGAPVREVVADVKALHQEKSSSGAFFQVASQFNLLEMISPSATPELGVGIYEKDPTQGPACAVAAGAGTIYRNYFVPIGHQLGQTRELQLDCLAGLGRALGNQNNRLWTMQNGYAQATREGLTALSKKLKALPVLEVDALRTQLQLGIQWNTQVTLPGASHQVTQAYCSALPVAYGSHPAELWEPFARLILEAAYEATLCAATLNRLQTGNPRAYLTLLGGGVFGNRSNWIIDSLQRALILHPDPELDVIIVSYGQSNPQVRFMVELLG